VLGVEELIARRRLADNRHEPPHARRVGHRDELLTVAARVHEVLILSKHGVASAAKVSLAQAHQGCVFSTSRAGVRGAGAERGHLNELDELHEQPHGHHQPGNRRKRRSQSEPVNVEALGAHACASRCQPGAQGVSCVRLSEGWRHSNAGRGAKVR